MRPASGSADAGPVGTEAHLHEQDLAFAQDGEVHLVLSPGQMPDSCRQLALLRCHFVA
jgi:hypothetical protein